MLSSVHGEIKKILVVFPGIRTKASEWEYAAIFEHFDPKGTVHCFQQEVPGCTFKVAKTTYRGKTRGLGGGHTREIKLWNANMNIEELLRRWKGELEALQLGGNVHYRRWAQDPFVTLVWQEAIILLQSYYTQRLSDHLLPLQLADQLGPMVFVKATKLYLEGGNILRSGDRVYVGQDLITQNQVLHGFTEDEAKKQLAEILGVGEVVPMGFPSQRKKWMTGGDADDHFTRQPLFHIDLFLTLGGRELASVREIIFVANARWTETLLREARNSNPRIYLPQVEAEIVEGLNIFRATLSDEDYAVAELPIFFFEGVCYSWNNCLVEVVATAKRVYLPSYQAAQDEEGLNATFKVLEDTVEKCFKQVDFEPIWIRNGGFFRIIASHGGSLHCAVKVLWRGD